MIELLISVSIILITLSAAMVNYLRFLDKQRLHQSGSAIETMLKEARSRAQSGYLGNEEIGYCNQLNGVEVYSSTNVEEQILFTSRLSCADGSFLPYESYTLEQAETAIDQHLSILFMSMRGATLTLGGNVESSGSATLSRQASNVTFNLDQGGTIDVVYE